MRSFLKVIVNLDHFSPNFILRCQCFFCPLRNDEAINDRLSAYNLALRAHSTRRSWAVCCSAPIPKLPSVYPRRPGKLIRSLFGALLPILAGLPLQSVGGTAIRAGCRNISWEFLITVSGQASQVLHAPYPVSPDVMRGEKIPTIKYTPVCVAADNNSYASVCVVHRTSLRVGSVWTCTGVREVWSCFTLRRKAGNL